MLADIIILAAILLYCGFVIVRSYRDRIIRAPDAADVQAAAAGVPDVHPPVSQFRRGVIRNDGKFYYINALFFPYLFGVVFCGCRSLSAG